ncbi:MAG: hypothetical protein IJ057_01435 [Bacteroidales bacterium]|nr:hypothetical protein [Bacteroidales bacterium]
MYEKKSEDEGKKRIFGRKGNFFEKNGPRGIAKPTKTYTFVIREFHYENKKQ